MSDMSSQVGALVARIPDRADGGGHDTIAAIDPLIQELVYSFMHWEAGGEPARSAMARLGDSIVDANELRVCHPSEISSVVGVRYPRSLERAERLCAALRSIYERENGLRLDHLREQSKREARAYLDSLAGVPRFVSARIVLLRLDGHAFPLDDRLRAMLEREGISFDGCDIHAAGMRMERAVRAADACDSYLALEAHCDAPAGGSAPKEPQPGTRKTASEQ